MPVDTKDSRMRQLLVLSMLLLAGCGYSSDHALGPHSQIETTYSNLSSVITGSVTTGTMKNPVIVTVDNQQSQVYLNNEFYFVNIPPPSANRWIELNATLADNKTLFSFFNGTPISRTSVTIARNADWHDETGSRLTVGGSSAASTVSINPFSNLAYWVRQANFTTYSTAKTIVNQGLHLPQCHFERQLCPEHIAYLQSGNNVYATMNGFVMTSPGNPDCTGPVWNFPACQ